MDRESALRQLDQIAQELAAAGQASLAERMRDAASALRNGSAAQDHDRQPLTAATNGVSPAGDLVSPEQAAALLGVRSAPMMMRCAREGILKSVLEGGKVWIERGSVERLIDSDLVLRQREYERELDEILEAFDAGDEELEPSASSSIGHKPWDSVGAHQS